MSIDNTVIENILNISNKISKGSWGFIEHKDTFKYTIVCNDEVITKCGSVFDETIKYNTKLVYKILEKVFIIKELYKENKKFRY